MLLQLDPFSQHSSSEVPDTTSSECHRVSTYFNVIRSARIQKYTTEYFGTPPGMDIRVIPNIRYHRPAAVNEHVCTLS